MNLLAFVALLAGQASCFVISAPRGVKAPQSPPRGAPPRAVLADAAASSAVTLATGSIIGSSSSTLLLAADPDFGEVFMAGMSIAFAAIGATVFVGILVRGRYDDVEKSFFEAQDEALSREKDPTSSTNQQAVSAFFGDTEPQLEAPPTAASPPPLQPNEPER